MADFDPAEVEDAARESETSREDAAEAGAADREALSQKLQDDQTTDRMTTIQQLETLKDGGVVTNPTPDTLSVESDLQKRIDAQDKLIEALGGKIADIESNVGKVSIDDTFDSTKNPTNSTFLKNLIDFFKEKFNIKSDADIEKIAKDAKDKAETTTNPKERGKWTRRAYIFGGLSLVGLTIAGLIELFKRLADEKSGCYQLQIGSGKEDILLNCGSLPLDNSNCNCEAASFTGLVANCTNITKDQTCDNNYKYLYRHYTAWDVFCDFVDTAAEDVQGAFNFLGSLGDFFKKYGIWIFIVILLIIFIPLVFKLLNN
jgi:hypothetical protein